TAAVERGAVGCRYGGLDLERHVAGAIRGRCVGVGGRSCGFANQWARRRSQSTGFRGARSAADAVISDCESGSYRDAGAKECVRFADGAADQSDAAVADVLREVSDLDVGRADVADA